MQMLGIYGIWLFSFIRLCDFGEVVIVKEEMKVSSSRLWRGVLLGSFLFQDYQVVVQRGYEVYFLFWGGVVQEKEGGVRELEGGIFGLGLFFRYR